MREFDWQFQCSHAKWRNSISVTRTDKPGVCPWNQNTHSQLLGRVWILTQGSRFMGCLKQQPLWQWWILVIISQTSPCVYMGTRVRIQRQKQTNNNQNKTNKTTNLQYFLFGPHFAKMQFSCEGFPRWPASEFPQWGLVEASSLVIYHHPHSKYWDPPYTLVWRMCLSIQETFGNERFLSPIQLQREHILVLWEVNGFKFGD